MLAGNHLGSIFKYQPVQILLDPTSVFETFSWYAHKIQFNNDTIGRFVLYLTGKNYCKEDKQQYLLQLS